MFFDVSATGGTAPCLFTTNKSLKEWGWVLHDDSVLPSLIPQVGSDTDYIPNGRP